MPGGASQPRRQLDGWQEFARAAWAARSGVRLGPVRWRARRTGCQEPLGVQRTGLAVEVGAAPGDCIFFAAGPRALAQSLLGAARLEIGRRVGLIDESAWAFCWVVDAPCSSRRVSPWPRAMSQSELAPGPPYTMPSAHRTSRPSTAIPAQHSRTPTTSSATAMRSAAAPSAHHRGTSRSGCSRSWVSKEEAQERFGFLLDAFNYGPPPHGGIAGWDRICALLSRN